MPQFARPSADTHVGAWTDDGGGAVNLFQAIDEVSPSDVDFIQSEFNPAASPYVTKLSNVSDPNNDNGHVVRYRAQKDPSNAQQVDLLVELRQGYVSEASLGTLIASQNQVNLPTTFTDFTLNLLSGEAAVITDYTDLYLRFVATQV